MNPENSDRHYLDSLESIINQLYTFEGVTICGTQSFSKHPEKEDFCIKELIDEAIMEKDYGKLQSTAEACIREGERALQHLPPHAKPYFLREEMSIKAFLLASVLGGFGWGLIFFGIHLYFCW